MTNRRGPKPEPEDDGDDGHWWPDPEAPVLADRDELRRIRAGLRAWLREVIEQRLAGTWDPASKAKPRNHAKGEGVSLS